MKESEFKNNGGIDILLTHRTVCGLFVSSVLLVLCCHFIVYYVGVYCVYNQSMLMEERFNSTESLEDVGTCCLPCLGTFSVLPESNISKSEKIFFLLIVLISFGFCFMCCRDTTNSGEYI